MRFLAICLGFLLVISSGRAMAQHIVSGIVTDQNGMPVPGVMVLLNGNHSGSFTDSSGRYVFRDVAEGKYNIHAAFLGFRHYNDTVEVKSTVQVNISLTPDVVQLREVIVRENYENNRNRREVLNIEVVKYNFIMQNNAGNLIKTIDKLPGVYSMDIGSGFSKPVIRGMGFNRVAVSENGIKQEGQQWGADHGLEVDLFNVDRMEIYKGPMSLKYGSDAIGGVIEILPAAVPATNKVFADAALIYKSNNNLAGSSAMIGFKQNHWYGKARITEQHFGDYKIPADTIVHLTRSLPVYKRRLKNTAGFERSFATTFGYTDSNLNSFVTISNVFQKTGFFPGSHGIPDVRRVQHDGNFRNIDVPNSLVNHFKVISNTAVGIGSWKLLGKFAFQDNLREEHARFHTHYGNQAPPEFNPDLELQFNLKTYTGSIIMETPDNRTMKYSMGFNGDVQKNDIAGYNFLLPGFSRLTSGAFITGSADLKEKLRITGGIRFDYGTLDIKGYTDTILYNYLVGMQIYDPSQIAFYSRRSFETNRSFHDISYGLGAVYTLLEQQTMKINIGRSFRLPSANEMAANGVHHGTFRHELGDTSLRSEKGYHLDLAYIFDTKRFYISVNPFLNWFDNYIFLEPSGDWSVLPHAGQIYRYRQAESLIAGGELTVNYEFLHNFTIESGMEYVYMQNLTDGYSLPFSPPLSVLNSVEWHSHRATRFGKLHTKLEHQFTSRQNRVARNETPTPGYHLFNLSLNNTIVRKKVTTEFSLQVQNIFNTRYFNHLSYYRKLNIPEPGRNLQAVFRFIFN